MALAIWDVATLILPTILAFYIFNILRSWRRPGRPPGPPAVPVLGHLHLIGELPHQSFYNLAKRYGPLMWLRLGSRPTLVVSSAKMAKQILGTHDLVFSHRPVTTAAARISLHGSDVAFHLKYDNMLKFKRQLLMTELLSTSRLRAFQHVRVDETRALIPLIASYGDHGRRPIGLRRVLLLASHNIICQLMMGSKIDKVVDGGDYLVDVVDEIMYLLGVFNVGDFIPWLSWLDPQGYLKRADNVARRSHAILKKVIDARRATLSHNAGATSSPLDDNPYSLLDKMLDPTTHLSDNQITGLMLDLILGGSETTATTIEWAMAELLRHPTKLQHTIEELDNVVGRSRLVNDDDIPKLPYLCAIIKETMRLHPVAPLLIPHMSSQEVQVEGFLIPSNTITYVNVWAIGRDPNSWGEPLEFHPERFINTNIDTNGRNFELLPFGSGRRGCLGRSLGVLNTHLMLATILQGFNWSILTESLETHDMSEVVGITLHMKEALCPLATPRLSKDFYVQEHIST